MEIKYIGQADVKGKRILARFDYNVPIKNGIVQDGLRIDETIQTITDLLERGAKKIIIVSHLGRPKGQYNEKYSLAPVAAYLAGQLKIDVVLAENKIDESLKSFINLSKEQIIMLENIRFYPEEEQNDKAFAKKLSNLADLYLNDAFGTCHRKHASTYEINRFFPNTNYAGPLIQREIKGLKKIIKSPEKPFITILGGAKVSDKINVISKLLPLSQNLLIGGAMAYPFLKAKGLFVGKSLCMEEDVKLANKLIKEDRSKKIILPIDHVVSNDLNSTESRIISEFPDKSNDIGLDIGPRSINMFKEYLTNAKTVFWNGPMGLFENPVFKNGTFELAKALSNLTDTYRAVGGGDSVSAIRQSGLAENFNHISTGGGASLEYIEHSDLVGLKALRFGPE